jgi:hypothetical protein
LDTQVLPTTGTYTLWVQHSGAGVGSETLQLSSVAPDVTGPITIDGSPVTVTTTTPGQDGRVTFSATAGQRISVGVTNLTNPSAYLYLVRPDGTTQTYIFMCCGYAYVMGTQVLATTGTYTLWVQHYGAGAGSETLQLNSVAP